MQVLIGYVTHYYTHLGVAIIALHGELHLGDSLLFLGHTTDHAQIVCSIEDEHRKITRGDPGQTVAIKVDEQVRIGDQVYRLLDGAGDPQNQLLWKGMTLAQRAIYHTYQGVFAEFEQSSGLSENIIGLLIAAVTMEPNATSPENLQIRGAYTAPQTYMARLQTAAEKGLLHEPEPGEFRLSQQGRQKIQKLINVGRKAMHNVDPLPPQDGQRLAELLGRLVQACLFTPPPPDTWSIRLSYQIMPAEEPPLPFIEQALSCLLAYRDDCHLAAWQPTGLSAPTLETLTIIWRDEAATLDQVYDKLAYRGFARHDYQAAINELQQRHFITAETNVFHLTQTGRVFRDQVEEETNSYFFTPWNCLEGIEKTELACLLASLCSGLKAKGQA